MSVEHTEGRSKGVRQHMCKDEGVMGPGGVLLQWERAGVRLRAPRAL